MNFSEEIKLRDYQLQSVEKLRISMREGHKAVVLCSPTGSGKTVVACHIIKEVLKKKRKVIFIADRKALIRQTSEQLDKYGVSHGIISGSDTFYSFAPVVVGSAQTISRRSIDISRFDLIIVDEAHTEQKSIVKQLQENKLSVIGLTATPFTGSMGKTYQDVVSVSTTNKLIDDGWLVPLKVYSATEIDMKGISGTGIGGEWSGRQAESRALPIIGDVVSEWVAHTNKVFGGSVKTLVYSTTIKHGQELAEEFRSAGHNFQYIEMKSSSTERGKQIQDFRDSKITGLISCEALAKGFDVPDVKCLCVVRPYRKSLAAHIQMLGRVMRPSAGKEFGLVLDHAGNYLRFASEMQIFYEYGVHDLNTSNGKQITPKKKKKTLVKCRSCGFILVYDDKRCPACGVKIKRSYSSGIAARPGRFKKYDALMNRLPNQDEIWKTISILANIKHPDDEKRALAFAAIQYKTIVGNWRYERSLDFSGEINPTVEAVVGINYKKWLNKQMRQKYRKRSLSASKIG